jgi:hypothetical protein
MDYKRARRGGATIYYCPVFHFQGALVCIGDRACRARPTESVLGNRPRDFAGSVEVQSAAVTQRPPASHAARGEFATNIMAMGIDDSIALPLLQHRLPRR